MINFPVKIIIFFSLFQAFNIGSFSEKTDSFKRYDIEYAYIKYIVSGNTKGTEELYFNDWGKNEKVIVNVITESTFYSVKNIQKENTISILNENFNIKIDLNNKTGVKTELINEEDLTFTNKNSYKHFDVDKLIKFGARRMGEGVILEKDCEIWNIYDNEIWLWKGIVLKLVAKRTGINRTTEAIKIETNKDIENKMFNLPNDVKIIDNIKKH